MTERRKNQSEEWTYFNRLFIYFIRVNKYRFSISVIGYINMKIIGIDIGYKKSISVDHYWMFCAFLYEWSGFVYVSQRAWCLRWLQHLPSQWGHKYMNNISKTDLRGFFIYFIIILLKIQNFYILFRKFRIVYWTVLNLHVVILNWCRFYLGLYIDFALYNLNDQWDLHATGN